MADDKRDLTGTVSECDEDHNIHDSGLYLNRTPDVDGGPDLVLSFSNPSTVVSATVSDDGPPLPGNLSTTWGDSGPQPLTLEDPSASSTSVSFPAPGSPPHADILQIESHPGF